MCIVFIAHTKTLQGNDIVSSANAVSGIIYKKQSDVVYYFGLKRMNESLMDENARLRKELDQIRTMDTLKDSMVHKPITTTDSTKRIIQYADYVYRTAHVINNSVNSANNYITIDRGSKDGISPKMAVITSSGVVGRVEHVSPHFASVLSVLSVQQSVSAKLKDGTFGYVKWDEKQPDELIMKEVPQQIKIKKGDSVSTTSYSFFPADVLIGTVTRIDIVKKNNQQILHLQPSTNFRNIQYVYVIENKLAAEKKQLEDSTGKK